jgi:ribosomal protein S18
MSALLNSIVNFGQNRSCRFKTEKRKKEFSEVYILKKFVNSRARYKLLRPIGEADTDTKS